MPARLGDRLSAARRSRFVGRDGERRLFETALGSENLPFNLLYIFGPGGVGKTSLLTEYRRLCDEASIPVAALDGRNLEPSPDFFIESLRAAFKLDHTIPLFDAIAALTPGTRRCAIIIDTYELIAPLDNWLHETLLPALPESVLTIIASRQPPASAWRSDPGWQSLVRIMPLRNLTPGESRAYLAQRNIPSQQHQAVLAFTHGHPLALSLIADEFAQRPEPSRSFQPEASPDVVKALLERFVQKVPSPAHRAALEACALVRLTTEPLLAEMLGTSDSPVPGADRKVPFGEGPPRPPPVQAGGLAHELFEWLRSLSFVEYGPQGLFPHDLARDALAAELRWRNPDWYAELHGRARTYYVNHIQKSSGLAQQRMMLDYVFLHRDSPVVRPFMDWQTSGGMITDSLRDSDHEAVREMVARHEGRDSAAIADHWMRRQPQGMLVLRDGDRQPAGFMSLVNLSQIEPMDREADPAARSASAYLSPHAPLRPGETATLFRFWMGRDSYQAVSPAQSIVFTNAVLHYLTTPGLVFTFFPCAEPEFWASMFAYADLARIAEADFDVGGRHYGMYGHNWRAVPPTQWLALLAERETGREAKPPRPIPVEPIVVLSEPEFANAVRAALRAFTRLDDLADSPLVQSRLVIEAVGANASRAERAAALQRIMQQAAELLRPSSRDMKFYRALHRTYLQPAETQEQAAEQLDLPFSTYRRHLKAGIDRIVEILWQRELHGLGN